MPEVPETVDKNNAQSNNGRAEAEVSPLTGGPDPSTHFQVTGNEQVGSFIRALTVIQGVGNLGLPSAPPWPLLCKAVWVRYWSPGPGLPFCPSHNGPTGHFPHNWNTK